MPEIPVLYSGQLEPGDLRFAEILEGRFGSEQLFGGRTWVDLLAVALGQGHARLTSTHADSEKAVQELRRRTGCAIRRGRLEGHKPISRTNLCVRHRDADASWQASCSIAWILDVGIELKVRWTDPSSKYANETRILRHRSFGQEVEMLLRLQ